MQKTACKLYERVAYETLAKDIIDQALVYVFSINFRDDLDGELLLLWLYQYPSMAGQTSTE